MNGRRTGSARSALLALAMFLPAWSGQAIPAGMAEVEPCSLEAPSEDKVVAELAEKTLVPGASDAAGILALFRTPEMARVAQVQARRQSGDRANLCKYQASDEAVLASAARPVVVFFGDSITENWKRGDPSLFDAGHLDRGISGQTTSQMLLRFYQDVVLLRPRVVHLMAGTNDVAGNTGPMSDAMILNNFQAMLDIAETNGIRVVLASILPAKRFWWRDAPPPAARIRRLNRQLHALADRRKAVWLDYHSRMADGDDGLSASLSNDGVHPNRLGYAAMRPLAEWAITRAAR